MHLLGSEYDEAIATIYNDAGYYNETINTIYSDTGGLVGEGIYCNVIGLCQIW